MERVEINMKPYRLKHISTGLYYQPRKHMGSNLSKKGKVYLNGTHGLSGAFNTNKQYPDSEQYKLFPVFCKPNSTIYKMTKDMLNWEESRHSRYQLKAYTKLSDWVIDELNT